jgi:hypothetical protein
LQTLEIAWKTERKGLGPHDWKPVYLKSIEELTTRMTSSDGVNKEENM